MSLFFILFFLNGGLSEVEIESQLQGEQSDEKCSGLRAICGGAEENAHLEQAICQWNQTCKLGRGRACGAQAKKTLGDSSDKCNPRWDQNPMKKSTFRGST